MAGALGFSLTGRRGSDEYREADRWPRSGEPWGMRLAWREHSGETRVCGVAWRAS